MSLTHRQAHRAQHESNKLNKRLMRLLGKAVIDYHMIEEGDRIMVCLSGGKDSHALLDLLLALRDRAPIQFDIVAVNLDQKQPGFPAHILPEYLRTLGVEFHIEEEDTYSTVQRLVPEGKTTCSVCARLRRAILYRVADELGATKIALGHHRDDMVETFFLNLFYGGKLKAMPPKLRADDGKHIVIRPLTYIAEADLIRYAAQQNFPIIPCDLCGSQENLKRKIIKAMLAGWEREQPGRTETIFTALSNIAPSHLMDKNWHDFINLTPLANLSGVSAAPKVSAHLQSDNAFVDSSEVLTPFAENLVRADDEGGDEEGDEEGDEGGDDENAPENASLQHKIRWFTPAR